MLPNPTEPNEFLAMLGAVALGMKPAPVQTAGEFFGLSAPPCPATPAARPDRVQPPANPQGCDSATFADFAMATLATLATLHRPDYQPTPRNRYAVDRLIECASKRMVAL